LTSKTPSTDRLNASLEAQQVSGMMRYPVMLAQARTLEMALHRTQDLLDIERRRVATEDTFAVRLFAFVAGVMVGGVSMFLIGLLMGAVP
jgi:hypothetical protein